MNKRIKVGQLFRYTVEYATPVWARGIQCVLPKTPWIDELWAKYPGVAQVSDCKLMRLVYHYED